MATFPIVLVLAALLCSLVAGFVFAFACIVMPGIATLDDRGFLRAFQVMDRVIQNNQPLFMLVWMGSVVAVIAAMVLGFGQLQGLDRMVLFVAGAAYLLGVQLPTGTINVPLNNQLQALDVQTLEDAELAQARAAFEPRWNRWNVIRTVIATLVTLALVILILRL